MSLPIRATAQDMKAVCNYFSKKPTGATLADAETVLGKTVLDSRKVAAYRALGIIELHNDRYKLTDRGRKINGGAVSEKEAYDEMLRECKPYSSILERANHKKEQLLDILEVASHWNGYFASDVSEIEKTLKEQVMSFFYILEGARIGKVVVGRRGLQTRFEIDMQALSDFVDQVEIGPVYNIDDIGNEQLPNVDIDEKEVNSNDGRAKEVLGQGIFIAHGKNKKPLEQLKRMLEQFKIPLKVATEEANLGRPISQKIRETMQACNCAVLLFTCDEEFRDKDGKTIWRPSENVVYELGAASYLYGSRIVIMKEDGVEFPSNFRDICYIPFDKDQLEAKALDIIKELIGFGIVKIST